MDSGSKWISNNRNWSENIYNVRLGIMRYTNLVSTVEVTRVMFSRFFKWLDLIWDTALKWYDSIRHRKIWNDSPFGVTFSSQLSSHSASSQSILKLSVVYDCVIFTKPLFICDPTLMSDGYDRFRDHRHCRRINSAMSLSPAIITLI